MSDDKADDLSVTIDARTVQPAAGMASVSPVALPELLAGRYRILGLLGAGGMGTVYRARDEHLDEVVALKVLRRDLVDQPEVVERFRREVKLARRVTHRNVARTFDFGEHGDDKFITMEYIDGSSLTDLLDGQTPLPVARVVELALRICEGLGAAHEVGVVHRDLKPDNVMLARDGRVLIADFGIARANDAGSRKTVAGIVGTPAYMAPEQVEGLPQLDARADLYALGVMLYELATGKLPWSGNSSIVVAAARLQQPPPDPRAIRAELPGGLADVILCCMARRPDDRYRSAAEVAVALAAIDVSADAHHAPPARAPGAAPHSHTSRLSQIATTEHKTVAVLPFRNAGPADDDYLADGLTDDLIDALSMTPGLRVRPRGVVTRTKAGERDPLELGRELNVHVIVDGTVRRIPQGLRIAARLVSVADGFQLWARRYDRPASDALVVGDEAAQAIAEALSVAAAPRRAQPIHPAALELYLRARRHYHSFVAASIAEAADLFQQALAIEPGHPTILTGHALAEVRLWAYRGRMPDADRARDAVERAVAAGPHLGEAHLAHGYFLMHMGDFAGAVREYQKALALAPSLADALEQLGRIEFEVGRRGAGLQRLESAVALDETATNARWTLARACALTGRWDRADALLADTPGAPTDVVRWANCVRLAIWRRDADRVRHFFDRRPADVMEVNAFAEGIMSTLLSRDFARDFDEKLQMLRKSGVAGSRAFFYQLRSEVAGYLDMTEVGIDSVTHATEEGLIDLAWLDGCAVLEGLRADPRFLAQRELVVARVRPVLEALATRAPSRPA